MDSLSRTNNAQQTKRICKAVCDACHANWQRATYIRAGGIKRQYTDVGEDHPIVHAAQVVDCDKRRMTLRLRSALLRSPLGVVRAVTKMLELRCLYRNDFSLDMIQKQLQTCTGGTCSCMYPVCRHAPVACTPCVGIPPAACTPCVGIPQLRVPRVSACPSCVYPVCRHAPVACTPCVDMAQPRVPRVSACPCCIYPVCRHAPAACTPLCRHAPAACTPCVGMPQLQAPLCVGMPQLHAPRVSTSPRCTPCVGIPQLHAPRVSAYPSCMYPVCRHAPVACTPCVGMPSCIYPVCRHAPAACTPCVGMPQLHVPRVSACPSCVYPVCWHVPAACTPCVGMPQLRVPRVLACPSCMYPVCRMPQLRVPRVSACPSCMYPVCRHARCIYPVCTQERERGPIFEAPVGGSSPVWAVVSSPMLADAAPSDYPPRAGQASVTEGRAPHAEHMPLAECDADTVADLAMLT